MCPTDKAANNIAFICKKYYVQVLLKELVLLNTTSNTYQLFYVFMSCSHDPGDHFFP